jgi:hypothetical protein|tara:strand:- start:2436 stop:3722 length:1287 start_codon:yes stop_codon:yes gene_type:complete
MSDSRIKKLKELLKNEGGYENDRVTSGTLRLHKNTDGYPIGEYKPIVIDHKSEFLSYWQLNQLLDNLRKIGIEKEEILLLDLNLGMSHLDFVIPVDHIWLLAKQSNNNMVLRNKSFPYSDKYIKKNMLGKKSKKFFCMVGSMHQHRVFILNEMFRRKLVDKGYVSAPLIGKHQYPDKGIEWGSWLEIIKNRSYGKWKEYSYDANIEDWDRLPLILDFSEEYIDGFIEVEKSNPKMYVNLDYYTEEEQQPYPLVGFPQDSTTFGHGLMDKRIRSTKLINDSYFYFCIESDNGGSVNTEYIKEEYDEPIIKDFFPNLVLTEKIYFAMITQPTLLLGSCGVWKYLRETWGFRSFPDMFDESYDEIEDDYDRFIFVMDELERVCNLSDVELMKRYKLSIPNVVHNQNIMKDIDCEKFSLDILLKVDNIVDKI